MADEQLSARQTGILYPSSTWCLPPCHQTPAGPLLCSQCLYTNPKCKYDSLCASVLFLNSTGFAALKKRWFSPCKSSWRISSDSEIIEITHSSLKSFGFFKVRVATYLQYIYLLLAMRIYSHMVLDTVKWSFPSSFMLVNTSSIAL